MLGSDGFVQVSKRRLKPLAPVEAAMLCSAGFARQCFMSEVPAPMVSVAEALAETQGMPTLEHGVAATLAPSLTTSVGDKYRIKAAIPWFPVVDSEATFAAAAKKITQSTLAQLHAECVRMKIDPAQHTGANMDHEEQLAALATAIAPVLADDLCSATAHRQRPRSEHRGVASCQTSEVLKRPRTQGVQATTPSTISVLWSFARKAIYSIVDLTGEQDDEAHPESRTDNRYVILDVQALNVRYESGVLEKHGIDYAQATSAVVGKAVGYSGSGATGKLELEDVRLVRAGSPDIKLNERCFVLGNTKVTWTDSAPALEEALRQVKQGLTTRTAEAAGDSTTSATSTATGAANRSGNDARVVPAAITDRVHVMRQAVMVKENERTQATAKATAKAAKKAAKEAAKEECRDIIWKELCIAINNNSTEAGTITTPTAEAVFDVARLALARGVQAAFGATRDMDKYFEEVAPTASMEERNEMAGTCNITRYMADATGGGDDFYDRLQATRTDLLQVAKGRSTYETTPLEKVCQRNVHQSLTELKQRSDGPRVFRPGVCFGGSHKEDKERVIPKDWKFKAMRNGKCLSCPATAYIMAPEWADDTCYGYGMRIFAPVVRAAMHDIAALVAGEWSERSHHARAVYFGGDVAAVKRIEQQIAEVLAGSQPKQTPKREAAAGSRSPAVSDSLVSTQPATDGASTTQSVPFDTSGEYFEDLAAVEYVRTQANDAPYVPPVEGRLSDTPATRAGLKQLGELLPRWRTHWDPECGIHFSWESDGEGPLNQRISEMVHKVYEEIAAGSFELHGMDHGQAVAMRLIQAGFSVSIHGAAGSGKTTVVKSADNVRHEHARAASCLIKSQLRTSGTGMAASNQTDANAVGQTFHSALSMRLDKDRMETYGEDVGSKFNKPGDTEGKRRSNIQHVINDLRKHHGVKARLGYEGTSIWIDEYLLMQPHLYGLLNAALRQAFDPHLVCGGLQVILTGDSKQMAPMKEQTRAGRRGEVYGNRASTLLELPFLLELVQNTSRGHVFVNLTGNHRVGGATQEDVEFRHVLKLMREGLWDAEIAERTLGKRLFTAADVRGEPMRTRVVGTRRQEHEENMAAFKQTCEDVAEGKRDSDMRVFHANFQLREENATGGCFNCGDPAHEASRCTHPRAHSSKKRFGKLLMTWQGKVPDDAGAFVGSSQATAEQAEKGHVESRWYDATAANREGREMLQNLSQRQCTEIEELRTRMWENHAQGAYSAWWAVPDKELRFTRNSDKTESNAFSSGWRGPYIDHADGERPRVRIPDGHGGFRRAVIEERVRDEKIKLRVGRGGDCQYVTLTAVLRYHVMVPFQAVTLGKMQGSEFSTDFNCWMDEQHIFLPQMAYMLFSRARSLSQLHILSELDPELVRCSVVLRSLDYILFYGIDVPWVEGYHNRNSWECVRGVYGPFARTLATAKATVNGQPQRVATDGANLSASSERVVSNARSIDRGRTTGAASTARDEAVVTRTQVRAWSAAELAAWFGSNGLGEVVARPVLDENISGEVALELDKEDWKEQGLSGVVATRVLVLLQKCKDV